MTLRPIAGLTLLLAAACAHGEPTSVDSLPAAQFLANLSQHCGKAFAGRITANEPAAPDDAFAGKPLVMHVRDCGPQEVRVPFHVGDDHSRTWVLTMKPTGLQLKHDHRHADGSSDVLTMYGGVSVSVDAGTAQRQEFPADQESKDLFVRERIPVSVDNTWAMEVVPGKRFVYELTRPNRVFRVEFDLSTPVDLPPDAWGYREPSL
jgi:hypothetical protein